MNDICLENMVNKNPLIKELYMQGKISDAHKIIFDEFEYLWIKFEDSIKKEPIND
jgi:hypothetical protein